MIFEGISVEPQIHKNRALPDYYISKCGKILSFKQTKATGIPKWHKVNKKQQIDHKERGSNPRYVRPKCTNLSIPIGFFPEYDFTRCTSNKGVKSKNHSKVPVRAHRAVKETYEPLDEYTHELGISKEEWARTPESVKQIVRECAYVDHVDGDTSNNDLSNLKWKTPLGNSHHRKNQEE